MTEYRVTFLKRNGSTSQFRTADKVMAIGIYACRVEDLLAAYGLQKKKAGRRAHRRLRRHDWGARLQSITIHAEAVIFERIE